MADEARLRDAVDFILHAADARGLRVVARALERRQTPESASESAPAAAPAAAQNAAPATPQRDIAESVSQRVAQQLAHAVDAGAMARDVVRRLILQNEPGITPAHLDVLLDAWVPADAALQTPAANGPGQPEAAPRGAEAALPAAALMAMITQFVSYSIGIMPAHEQRDLPSGWSKRYWAVFSSRTQTLIKELLTDSIDAAAFWRDIRAHIGPVAAEADAATGSAAAPPTQ